MTTARDRDVLERLRTCNPVAAGELADLVWADAAQAQFRLIVATPPPVPARAGRPPRPGSGRRMPRVAVLAGLVSMSVAVAAYAIVGRQTSKPQNVACFAAADLGAKTAVVRLDARGPVAACATVWDEGYLGAAPRTSLRACLLESGVVGVFPEAPGGDVCLDLGLAAAASPVPVAPDRASPSSSPPAAHRPDPDDPVVDHARFFAFRDAVLPRFLSLGCLGPAAAEAIVREELDRAGLDGWTVITGKGADGAGFSEGRPCASLNFRPEAWTVELVPLPWAG